MAALAASSSGAVEESNVTLSSLQSGSGGTSMDMAVGFGGGAAAFAAKDLLLASDGSEFSGLEIGEAPVVGSGGSARRPPALPPPRTQYPRLQIQRYILENAVGGPFRPLLTAAWNSAHAPSLHAPHRRDKGSKVCKFPSSPCLRAKPT